MASVSAAAVAAGSEGWLPDSPLTVMVFPLNVVVAVAGAALSGMIGRDSPAARVRGALDCGAFGLIIHLIATTVLVAALPALGFRI